MSQHSTWTRAVMYSSPFHLLLHADETQGSCCSPMFATELLARGLKLPYTALNLGLGIFLFTQCYHIYGRIKINTQACIRGLSKIFSSTERGI